MNFSQESIYKRYRAMGRWQDFRNIYSFPESICKRYKAMRRWKGFRNMYFYPDMYARDIEL